MSREIKFRAWDFARTVMIGSDYPKNWNRSIDEYEEWWSNEHKMMLEGIEDIIEDERFNVMQYTGLKDKNGQEIYEGDVLKFKSLPAPYNIIEFNLGSFGYFCMKGKDYEYFIGIERTYDKPKNWEIIGNIHENPELLK